MARRYLVSPIRLHPTKAGQRRTDRPRGSISIATAAPGEPVTIAGRIARVTVEPATSDTGARMIVWVTDGSAEASVHFPRGDAPRLATGAHVVADGLFTDFESPRRFEPILLAVVDDDDIERRVFPRIDPPE